MSETESETERTELADLAETRKAGLAELTLNDTLTIETPSGTYEGRIEEMRVVDDTDYRVKVYADGCFHVLRAEESPVKSYFLILHEEGKKRYRQRAVNVWVE